jgi:hypothetical protein
MKEIWLRIIRLRHATGSAAAKSASSALRRISVLGIEPVQDRKRLGYITGGSTGGSQGTKMILSIPCSERSRAQLLS